MLCFSRPEGATLSFFLAKVQVDRMMHASAVGVPAWKKKPPPRQIPAMKFPAMCKPSKLVQHVWVHTTATVIRTGVIG